MPTPTPVTIAPLGAFTSRSGSAVIVRGPRGVGAVALTAAHVASFAGKKNVLDVKIGEKTRRGRVVGVHAELDLALVDVDDVFDDALVLDVMSADDIRVGMKVEALGVPQAYAGIASAAFRFVLEGKGFDEPRLGTIMATCGGTHAMHTAAVAAGMSGGALVERNSGRVIGVHSFGDAFFGGKRDVCVLAERIKEIEVEDNIDPEAYDSRRVNAMIFASSDKALRELAPELSASERAKWIF